MKFFVLGFICLALWGCGQEKIGNTRLINGYWEIEKVRLASGETKTYTINTVVDYFLLTGDSTGIRQKVMPQLDGTFISNGEQEVFTINSKEDDLYLHYSTEEAQHTEQLIKLNQNELVVTNKDQLTYYYKPFEKFELK